MQIRENVYMTVFLSDRTAWNIISYYILSPSKKFIWWYMIPPKKGVEGCILTQKTQDILDVNCIQMELLKKRFSVNQWNDKMS